MVLSLTQTASSGSVYCLGNVQPVALYRCQNEPSAHLSCDIEQHRVHCEHRLRVELSRRRTSPLPATPNRKNVIYGIEVRRVRRQEENKHPSVPQHLKRNLIVSTRLDKARHLS